MRKGSVNQFIDELEIKIEQLKGVRSSTSVVSAVKKPKYWDTMFRTKVIDAYNKGELTTKNIEEWETKYNGGVRPNKSLGTKEILDYYRYNIENVKSSGRVIDDGTEVIEAVVDYDTPVYSAYATIHTNDGGSIEVDVSVWDEGDEYAIDIGESFSAEINGKSVDTHWITKRMNTSWSWSDEDLDYMKEQCAKAADKITKYFEDHPVEGSITSSSNNGTEVIKAGVDSYYDEYRDIISRMDKAKSLEELKKVDKLIQKSKYYDDARRGVDDYNNYASLQRSLYERMKKMKANSSCNIKAGTDYEEYEDDIDYEASENSQYDEYGKIIGRPEPRKYRFIENYKGVDILKWVSGGDPEPVKDSKNYVTAYPRGKQFGTSFFTLEDARDGVDEYERDKRYYFKDTVEASENLDESAFDEEDDWHSDFYREDVEDLAELAIYVHTADDLEKVLDSLSGLDAEMYEKYIELADSGEYSPAALGKMISDELYWSTHDSVESSCGSKKKITSSEDKWLYTMCDECGYEGKVRESSYDGCCPMCHDHTGGYNIVEDDEEEIESSCGKKSVTSAEGLDGKVTIGIYGDEVDRINAHSVNGIVSYLERKGFKVTDVEGDMDYGWEMNVTGYPKDLFAAICNVFPGYNGDSVSEFIESYRVDDEIESSCITSAEEENVEINEPADENPEYLTGLYQSVEQELNDLAEGFSWKVDEDNIYLDVNFTDGHVFTFTIPKADLAYDIENMDKDIQYICVAVREDFGQVANDVDESDVTLEEYDIPAYL